MIRIVVIGLNHRTASVETREKFSLGEERLAHTLLQLNQLAHISECVIVSTCNRMEIYVVVERALSSHQLLTDFIAQSFDVKQDQFKQHVYVYDQEAAVRHLLRVITGLDSMIVGETQIIGQVRHAFFTAQQLETTNTLFNTLFRRAITFAKRAHRETQINDHAVSISYAAVELSKQFFGEMKGKRALLIGAGKMSELSLQYLMASGVTDVVIANRTEHKAAQLADDIQAVACSIDDVAKHIQHIDIVISSTSAAGFVLTKEQIEHAREPSKPLLLIDIAVPRDIDPRLAELPHTILYDIDDLEGVIQSNMAQRQAAAETIEVMIDDEITEFNHWLKQQGAGPLIGQLQQRAASIHQETVQSLFNRLPNLDEREKKVIEQLSRSMLNQMLQVPITNLKQMLTEGDAAETLALFMALFSLQADEVVDQEVVQIGG